VKFNRRARPDRSQVRDRRGAGPGVAVGGGIGGIILLLVVLLGGGDPGTLLSDGSEGSGTGAQGTSEVCGPGEDPDSTDCRLLAVVGSVQSLWEDQLGERYRPAVTNVFEGSVSTACGRASSQVGPFYCPGDEEVYLDLGFFEVLRRELGAQGGDFAEAYVIAHEYGHHVQHLTGQMERVRTREGADSDAVRLELQADCYAGVWGHHATRTTDEAGEVFITEISDDDIAEAVDAAEVIGDDYIQERMRGTVTPETWTHGSSEQRRRWFRVGLDTGDADRCDTFAADRL
jgi:uncharacterized protein